MKKNFFVVAAVFISSSLSTFAQHTSDTLGRSLDEAIITANKYPSKTSMTGKVLTIITREQLEKSGGKDLSQVLGEQAGLITAGANSNPGKDKSIFLWGAHVEHTLITIDGIPVLDPSGVGGNFDIRNLSVHNIERIEILKGSQSTLYGSDAIAGVINIITRKSTMKTLTGNLGASYGTNETFRGNAGLNGRSGIVDYNFSYAYLKSAGINEAVNRSNAPVTDRDEYLQHNVQLGVGIRANDKVYIQPFFRFGYNKGSIDLGAFTDELDYTYRQKNFQAGIRNEFALGKSKLTVLYSYNSIDRLYIDDSVKSQNGFDKYSRGTYKGFEHFVDAFIHVPLEKGVKLTAGLDVRNAESDQEYLSISSFSPFPYNPVYSSDSLKQNQFSLYATADWNHKSGFNVGVGSRVNLHSEYGTHVVFNVNPSYLVNKQVKFFANLSSGYRTPSLYQLFSEFGNRNLKPEAALSFEGGLQYFSPKDKFTARGVVFSRKVKDLIFFYSKPGTFQSFYINQDEQKDYGFETEGTFNLGKSTTLRAYYTFVTGKINTVFAGKDTTFDNLLRRPRSSAGLTVSNQSIKKMVLSSSLFYYGKRKDAYFDNSLFTTVHTTMKSYWLLDLYAEYGFVKEKLKVFANLRNITGSKYTEISGFNTLGFNGYGGVRFSF